MDTIRVNSISDPNSPKQRLPPNNNKCLLFDRRYGLVYDVWKDPSEEALSGGGRGMFCILPLASAFINSTSHAINLIASSTLEVLEKPDIFTHEVLQVNLNSQVQRITSSMKKPQFDLPMLKRSPSFSSNPPRERNELHNV